MFLVGMDKHLWKNIAIGRETSIKPSYLGVHMGIRWVLTHAEVSTRSFPQQTFSHWGSPLGLAAQAPWRCKWWGGWCYCGWASEILHHQKDGWNPFFNHGMFTIYQLVLRISLASTGWLSSFDASNLGQFGGLAGTSRDPPADKSQGVLPCLGPTSTKFYPV